MSEFITFFKGVDVNKSQLRVQFKKHIHNLSAQDRAEQSQAIASQLVSFFADKQGIWTLFSPLKDEPNLVHLLQESSHIQWVFPVVISKSNMVFKKLKDVNQWVTSAWGIDEPSDSSEQVACQNIDGVIVPGLAFDRRGYRLGRGGGYYDRFLENFKGLKLGVTFSETLSMEALPSEPHDQQLDIIVSPSEWIDLNQSEVNYGF